MRDHPLPADTRPVRPGEEIDAAALSAWLATRLPDPPGSDLSVRQFPGGHSNLTYLVQTGAAEYVLRRGPLGPVAPKAHDMAREFTVLAALHPHFPAAPRPVLLCEDPAVIGVVFFLMERRRGVILRTAIPEEWADIAALPSHVSAAFVDCLASLHALDVAACGLASLGRAEGFLDRQVRGWTDRWERARTAHVPDVDAIAAWLAAHVPQAQRASLVHNDFKLDNLMLDPADPGRIVAVLDWEMATIGDPLADLGLSLCYWTSAARFGVTGGPGWYTREQIVERYAVRSGLDLSRLPWYEALGLFKLIVILQQIYQRYLRGQTRDERFHDFGAEVLRLAALATRNIEAL